MLLNGSALKNLTVISAVADIESTISSYTSLDSFNLRVKSLSASDFSEEKEKQGDIKYKKKWFGEGTIKRVVLTFAIFTKWLNISALIFKVCAVKISRTTQKLTYKSKCKGYMRQISPN